MCVCVCAGVCVCEWEVNDTQGVSCDHCRETVPNLRGQGSTERERGCRIQPSPSGPP